MHNVKRIYFAVFFFMLRKTYFCVRQTRNGLCRVNYEIAEDAIRYAICRFLLLFCWIGRRGGGSPDGLL